jgi:hypothetical protein
MTRINYARVIDKALKPLGFDRDADDWIRIRGDRWECVNRYSSWLGGVHVTLSMKDLETQRVYRSIFHLPDDLAWGGYLDEDLGVLVNGRQGFWMQDTPNGAQDLVDKLLTFGLPWFETFQTPEQVVAPWRARTDPPTYRAFNPTWLITYMICFYRLGDLEAAREVLRTPAPRLAPPKCLEAIARASAWLEARIAAKAQMPGLKGPA